MQVKFNRGVWLAVPILAFVYLYGLSGAGLVGPDEPRYAAVARAMASSGDWVTPRLWGEAWFEKPALLYWMGAAGFRLGLGREMAVRLPVALLALVFLGFYWWILRQEFGGEAAWYATLILGTSAGWMGFSQIGVTDLPMTAAYSAAMLLALPWVAKGDRRLLPLVAALLGAAVLAKGLVPAVLALPLMWRGRARDLLRWQPVAAFLAVALPWYALCYLRNGRQFVDVFFGQQQFARLSSPALQHMQPWWFYVPVLAVGLVPWTPLAALAGGRANWSEPRRRFLLDCVLLGLLFFSAAVNKLPGYVLPLVPAVCALMGIGLAEAPAGNARNQAIRAGLGVSAVLLGVFQVAARVAPVAVRSGLSRAPGVYWDWSWLAAAGIGVIVWAVAGRRRFEAVTLLAGCAAAGFLYLKIVALPELDRVASARGLWEKIESRRDQVCIGSLNRSFRYGLNYYAGGPLADCSADPRPLQIQEAPGGAPYIAAANSSDAGVR